MPAKRKEEVKSATDLEISAAYDAMMKGEAAVQNCKDAIDDLVAHSARLKQLESELAPRETEHKAILDRFQRIVENGCTFRKQRGPGAHIAAATNASLLLGKPTTPRGRAMGSSPSSDVALGGMGGGSNEDKELNKFIANASRDFIVASLYPIFMMPRTPSELHNAAVLQAKLAEVTAGPFDPNAAPTAGTSGKMTPRKKAAAAAGGPVIPLSQQPLRPEPALLPPIGVDIGLHNDALKLRDQRLAAERVIEDLQAQIRLSRETLQRRKDEGCGTKAALKKAERDLNVLIKAHSALTYKKEGEEIIKRKEEAAAAVKKTEEKKKK